MTAGVELELARLSVRLWAQLDDAIGGFEYRPKGGLMVAGSEGALAGIRQTAVGQRALGVDAVNVAPADLPDYEPHLARDLLGGTYYPEDAQVQPMLAAARLLADVRIRGTEVRTGTDVTGLLRSGERVVGVRTP